MEKNTFICKKCGMNLTATCSKCDRIVDVKQLSGGCLVQITKCSDCANTPVVRDICNHA